MQEFSLRRVADFVRTIMHYENAAFDLGKKGGKVVPSDRETLAPLVGECKAADGFFYLPQVSSRADRLSAALAQPGATHVEIGYQLRAMREELDDELSYRSVFFMSAGRSLYYHAGQRLLGEDVLQRFPDHANDIEEAGKCLGCGRFTAAVFHLMRIMEAAVHELGARLALPNPDSKNWQLILSNVDEKLRQFERSDPNRVRFAEMVALLRAVGLAWRNEVMHPRAVYTEEEAVDVLHAVKAFLPKFAEVCPRQREA